MKKMNLGKCQECIFPYFAMILPGNATLRVYFLPPDGAKIAVGFDVSTPFLTLLKSLLRLKVIFSHHNPTRNRWSYLLGAIRGHSSSSRTVSSSGI